jgi:lactate dehydrogenase-like 2-hydroxyacid dehydrogenase
MVDEDALYAVLKDGHLGGAALDVWWQCPTQAEPERRPSRRPFHELPNDAAFLERHPRDRRAALECGGRQSRPLRARRAA